MIKVYGQYAFIYLCTSHRKKYRTIVLKIKRIHQNKLSVFNDKEVKSPGLNRILQLFK